MGASFDRITHRPDVLAGRATIRGLRISVAHVVNLIANGMTAEQIVADLPDLEPEDIRQATTIRYASRSSANFVMMSLSSPVFLVTARRRSTVSARGRVSSVSKWETRKLLISHCPSASRKYLPLP